MTCATLGGGRERPQGPGARGARPARRQAREEVLERTRPREREARLASLELSGSLHGIREVLRERLPRCAVERGAAGRPVGRSDPRRRRALVLDQRLDARRGRAGSGDARLARGRPGERSSRTPSATSAPTSSSSTPALGAERTRGHGFTAFFTLSAPSLLVERLDRRAARPRRRPRSSRSSAPPVGRDPHAVRSTILGELGSRGPLGRTARRRARPPRADQPAAAHRRRIADRVGRRLRRAARASRRSRSSCRSTSDSTSSSTSCSSSPRDPRLRRGGADLRARLGRAGATSWPGSARELFALYGLPFRVVNLVARAPASPAPTTTASRSPRAKRLLLLNSDVIPDRPGWLGAMSELLRRHRGDRGARPEAALRGRLAPARRPVLPSRRRRGAVGERALLQGPAQELPGGQRRAAGAGGDRRLHADRPRALRGGRRSAAALRAGRLRGLRAVPAPRRGGPRELVPARRSSSTTSRASPTRPGVRRVPSEYNMWLHTLALGRADRVR